MEEQTAYRVLARKYRPQDFSGLIGQEPMVRTLSNAFRSGRIAQAYMLTGVRGVGKTTTARILARALNYIDGKTDEPTIELRREGEHCRAIMEGRHVDVIEMDAASHTGIDDIRDIIESVQYAPAVARYKVYIIDEVHMLSRNAFNGLLKTLEEPPAHLKFIFATTEIRKVPVTVLSRCQRFDLRRIETGEMVEYLKSILEQEKVKAEDEALNMIARASEGSMRDGLSMLDQAIAYSDGNVLAEGTRAMLGLADRARIIDLFNHVMSGDIAAALAEVKEQYDTGADPYVVLTDLADFIHYVTRLKYSGQGDQGQSGFSEAERKRGREFAERLSVRVLARAWQILLKGMAEVAGSERALAAADMVLVRLTHAADLPGHEELVQQWRNGGQAQTPERGPAAKSSSKPEASKQAGPASEAANPTVAQMPQQPASPTADPNEPPAAMAISGAAAPKPEKAQAPETPLVTINTFEEMIFLAEDRRDLKAKRYLRQNVRLIDCSAGRLEFNQAGQPPREELHYLKRFLETHTGIRWSIVVSDGEGLPTLEEVERAEKADRMEQARTHPAVKSILNAFEGARIVDVRIRNEADPPAPPDDEEHLDDFFK